MDKNYISLFRVLNAMHFKTSSLFQDLINEINHYKNISENLEKMLEKYASEIAHLKGEKKTLEDSSINLECTLYNCLLLLNKIDFSKSGLENEYCALLENDWIKNHKNEKSENKLQTYASSDSFKLTVKSDSVSCQNNSGNEKLRLTLSNDNKSNEISSTNINSSYKECRNLEEHSLPNIGASKLNHSFLNVETFKIQNWESVYDNTSHDLGEKFMSSFVMEEDEDEVIFDSPKLAEPFKSRKKNEQTVDVPKILVPPSNPVECEKDLDETYINTAVINHHQLEAPKTFKVNAKWCNQNQFNREKSPEYDVIPFCYNRNSLKKKSDRMKLPGQACSDCNQYYKNVLGSNFTAKKFREILNKCSRHREKNSPSIDNTPPGYWKPYLTPSEIFSKAENIIENIRN